MRLYAGVIPVDGLGVAALQQRDHSPGIENPGLVTVFGGLAERGENAVDAALREASEELGLRVSRALLQPLLTHEKRQVGSAPTMCVIFRVPVPSIVALRTAEGVGVLVGTPAELLLERRLTDTCRRAVDALCRGSPLHRN
ncbi:NUDIX domain-containing protein [Streptomyces sp. Agncl-13]|uniref:NUDIX domain-containing protein n=1 Tax=Streptomyces sp. Agncl-13 TaxID=3400628 RepID=UPI003A89AF96